MIAAGRAAFDLFPASGLDNSLFAAVLLGLLCMLLLTESFGWVFTGLVVPGYLASVLVIQPLAGGVILLEAVATYLVARCVGEWLSPWMPWNRFFGRERFFLILLCSVAVRLLFEAVLLPAAGSRLADGGWVAPDVLSDLFSVGLIVVPLTANMMWNTGLARGLPQVLLATAVLWAVLAFVLIPYTNLSISDFEITYEDVAQGFLSSPTTYIILLVGAYLATRTSITWGWDSHGIVVVALVALAWLSPAKVLSTVAEVLLLASAVRLLLHVPWLRRANVEGPRRIVLVFSVGFVLKFALCHAMAASWPGLKATDYFGFGYLLPSLLALRVLDRKSAARVLLPTLETSAAALVLGTGIGLGMALLDPAADETGSELARADEAGPEEPAPGLAAAVQRAAGQLLSGPPSHGRSALRPEDLAAWGGLVREVAERRAAPGGTWEAAVDAIGLAWRETAGPDDADRYVVFGEPAGRLDALAGWGILAVRRDVSVSLVVEVPRPVGEPGSLACAVALALELDAAALLVAGTDAGGDVALPGIAPGEPPLAQARQALGRMPVLEVRAGGGAGPSVLLRADDALGSPDMAALARIVGPVVVEQAAGSEPQEAGDGARRSRLVLSAEGAAAGWTAAFPPVDGRPAALAATGGLSGLGGQGWFLDRVSALGWRPPLESEILLLQRELLEPLLLHPAASAGDDARLARLDRLASVLGYSVELLALADGERLLLLAEEKPALRGWGSVLVRPGARSSLFLAVPDPEREAHTLDLALHLLRELDGAALLLGAAGPAGAVRDAETEPRGHGAWGVDLLTSAHRVALRAGRDGRSAAVVQVRGRAATRRTGGDLVLATGVLLADLASAVPELGAVAGEMRSAGMPVLIDGGRPEMADLHGPGISQVRLARNLDGLPLGVLWASPGMRRRVSPADGLALTRAARRAGIAVQEVWLDRWWSEAVPPGARAEAAALSDPPDRLGADWRGILEACAALLRTADTRYLGDVARQAEESAISLLWLVDRESDLPTLWLRRGEQAAATNLLAPRADWTGTVERPVAALRTGLVPMVLVDFADGSGGGGPEGPGAGEAR